MVLDGGGEVWRRRGVHGVHVPFVLDYTAARL